jgi:hypothetical protein
MAYGQGFAGNFLGALGQQQQMGAQQAQAGNAQWDQMYKLAALQGEVEEREYMRAQQAQQQAAAAEAAKREQAQKLQLAKDQWDLRNQLPEHLRELSDIDMDTAIARGFPEAPKPGSQYKVAGTDIFDVSGDKPRLAAQGRRSGEPLVKVMTPEGPVLMERSKAVGKTPYESGGMTVYGPDGQPIVTTGGQPGQGVMKKTEQDLETSVINNQEMLARLGEIENTFNSEFMTYKGAAKAEAFRQMEKAGVPLTGERKAYLADYTVVRQNLGDNLAQYVKAQSGTAASEPEQKRLSNNLPNEDDSPTQYMAKAKNKIDQLKAVNARFNYLRYHGIPLTEGIAKYGMDKVPDLIQERGEELEKEAAASGAPPDQIEAQVNEILKLEFGL